MAMWNGLQKHPFILWSFKIAMQMDHEKYVLWWIDCSKWWCSIATIKKQMVCVCVLLIIIVVVVTMVIIVIIVDITITVDCPLAHGIFHCCSWSQEARPPFPHEFDPNFAVTIARSLSLLNHYFDPVCMVNSWNCENWGIHTSGQSYFDSNED